MGSGSASRIITDDSETLGLDSWEFEVAGGVRVELQTGMASVGMDRMSNL
jgi:hypothetical protein